MCALQLTYAHSGKEPNAEAVRAMMEQLVREHARAAIDRIVNYLFALLLGPCPADSRVLNAT